MFDVQVWYNLAACVDGTSNTIMLSEHTAHPSNSSTEMVGTKSESFFGTFYANAPNTVSNNPSICQGYKKGRMIEVASAAANNFNIVRGNLRLSGRIHDSGFTTILPPNSASCGWATPGGGSAPHYESGIFSASSHHSGGVQVCRGDGSVSFVSDTVDCGTTSTASPGSQSGAPKTGKSPYGVWGAMGTKDGGESKTI